MSNNAETHNIPPKSSQVALTTSQEPLSATVPSPHPSPPSPLPNVPTLSGLQKNSTEPAYPNIIIFGETGTGKSSLINMLGGAPLAGVSSQALGFTFANAPYLITLGEQTYRIWDTAGLNEGQQGTIPAEDALNNLKNLVQSLGDGINLLVYCFRGTRFRDILRVNYDMFTGIICQKQVPVVAVITGLENESPMDSWWEANQKEFKNRDLVFAGQACVTTSKGKQMKDDSFMYEEEYQESEEKVRELLQKHCTKDPWKNDSEKWISEINVRMVAYMERYNNRTGTEREVIHIEDEGGENSYTTPPKGSFGLRVSRLKNTASGMASKAANLNLNWRRGGSGVQGPQVQQ